MLPLTPWSRRLNRRGGDRTHDLELIRLPLSPLSYAPQRVGPVGFEPTPTWLKARDAAVTPRPHSWSGVSVSIVELMTSCCSCWLGFEIQVVVLGIELSAAVLSGPLGQPALDYHFLSAPSVRTAGFEPAIPWPPTRCDSQASPRSEKGSVLAQALSQPDDGPRIDVFWTPRGLHTGVLDPSPSSPLSLVSPPPNSRQ